MIDPFKRTAKIYGVSKKEVMDEIYKAIAAAYENPNSFAKSVPKEGEVPTVDEVFDFIIETCIKSSL